MIRDDAILETIRARLLATEAFDAVHPGTPSADDVATGLAVRGVAWAYWVGADETSAEAIGALGPTYERTVEWQLVIHAIAEDRVARLRRLARLEAIARNAILDRTGDPPWRWITLGRGRTVRDVAPPAVRVLIPGTAVYGVEAAAGRDETAVEGV